MRIHIKFSVKKSILTWTQSYHTAKKKCGDTWESASDLAQKQSWKNDALTSYDIWHERPLQ